MKFTLDWLKDHLDTTETAEAIVEKLTALGMEVESFTDRAAVYAPFAVALIEKAEKHPDADRLKVCTVNTGRETLQVVCGAPNARTGMKGIFAPAGSLIPGTDAVLKKGVIRGVESNGMMVSEREMGLSDEHTGIIEVPGDTPLGTPMAALYGLNDPVIDIAITPNRGDWAGVRGVARELAASGMGMLKPLDTSPVPGAFACPVSVRIDSPESCPLFLGRLVRGVKNGPSPEWLQRRLKAVGQRPISALVDVTNYLSIALCRPLHVYDAARLSGGLVVRSARKDESFAALDGNTYALEEGMCAICDDSGVLGLGGIIGGVSSGCTDSTTDVFIECAWFDPLSIARAGRALGIASDARYRFERGVDPDFVAAGLEVATRLILDLCGGQASKVVTSGAPPEWRRTIKFAPATVRRILGCAIAPDDQIRALSALGFETTQNTPEDWSVAPPSWRPDVEGSADLVEDIARIYGYDRIPAAPLPEDPATDRAAETPTLLRARRARSALSGRAMEECVTWSFLSGAAATPFAANDQFSSALTLKNPISAELGRMRPSILPNLIDAARRGGARGFADSALFEVGPVFTSPRPDGQQNVAAGIRFGAAAPRHWAAKDPERPADAFDVKADALAVLRACGAPVENLQIVREAPGFYHPGRSGSLRLGAKILAYFGEIHPGVLTDLDVKGTVAAFEVFLDAVSPARKKGTAKPALSLSAFQPLSRDFAFIVDAQVDSDAIVKAIRMAEKTLLSSVDVFDVYAGKGVEEGKKSIAVGVTIQPLDRTLAEADIDALAKKIVESVAAKTGAVLRG